MPAGCRRCNPAEEYEGEEPSCFYLFILFFCLRRPASRRWTATRSQTLTSRKMLTAFFRNFYYVASSFILLLRKFLSLEKCEWNFHVSLSHEKSSLAFRELSFIFQNRHKTALVIIWIRQQKSAIRPGRQQEPHENETDCRHPKSGT